MLAELAIGQEEEDLVDHSNYFAKLIKRTRLNLKAKIAELKYERAKKKVNQAEYVLNHVQNQYAVLQVIFPNRYYQYLN